MQMMEWMVLGWFEFCFVLFRCCCWCFFFVCVCDTWCGLLKDKWYYGIVSGIVSVWLWNWCFMEREIWRYYVWYIVDIFLVLFRYYWRWNLLFGYGIRFDVDRLPSNRWTVWLGLLCWMICIMEDFYDA